MVSCKRLALVLVITVVLIEKNTMLLIANAEIPTPKQCTQYTTVTENLRRENGVIFINTKLISSSLCTHKQPKNGWYRFRYRLNAPFSLNKDFDGGLKFLGLSENISCLRNDVPEHHACRIHETITSKLCFEVSRKIRIGRSVNVTNCGSFYVYQLFQFTCKDDTPSLQRLDVDKTRDNNSNIRPTGNVRQKRDITPGKWSIIPGSLKQIDHGLTTAVWGVKPNNSIYRLRRAMSAWKRIPGSLKHVSAGEAGIWGVDKNDNIYYRVGVTESNPDGNSWRRIQGKLKQIDSGPNGIVFGVDAEDKIFCRTGIEISKPFGAKWTQVMPSNSRLKYVSCGVLGCWGVNINDIVWFRSGITKENCNGVKWYQINGINLKQIEVGKAGNVYGISPAGDQVFRRTGISNSSLTGSGWQKIKANGFHITTGLTGLYLLVNGGQIHHYNENFPKKRPSSTATEATVTTSHSTPTFRSTTTRKANVFADLDKEIDELERNNNISEKEAQKIINELSLLTDLDKLNDFERENGIKPQSINDTVRILKRIVNLNITGGSLNILGPANNILDGRNVKSWHNLTNNTIISDLITTLEDYAFQYAGYLENNPNVSRNFTYENLQLRVKYIKQSCNVSMEERTFKFLNASFNLSPDALSKTLGTKVAVMWYKTMHYFIRNSLNGSIIYGEVNSEIITASVRPTSEAQLFKEPVRMTWNSAELNYAEKCVYWKPDRGENKWKTDGCRSKKDKSNHRLICECDHLTAFALIDISRNLVDKEEQHALELISTIGCSMSLVGIFLTILTYALLWKRLHQNTKSSIPSQILMHLCVAIGMTDIFAILAGPARNNETFCEAVSILLYFFILTVFGWMLCEGIVIYLQLVNVYTGLGLGGRHLKYFYLIGWGVPVVVVTVLVGANDRSDFVTEHACWCGGGGAIFWTFAATIGLILLINIVIFILALRSALSSSHVAATSKLNIAKNNTTTTKASADEILGKVKVGLRGSAVLLPLLGLTWVFGLLVFNREAIVFKYLFAICNSLQGVMIFIFHVFFNRKIREGINKERTARTKVRNNGKVMVSNNESSTTPNSEIIPGNSSAPGTPAHPRKRNYDIMQNIKVTIFKKYRNHDNWSKGDSEEYIEIPKL